MEEAKQIHSEIIDYIKLVLDSNCSLAKKSLDLHKTILNSKANIIGIDIYSKTIDFITSVLEDNNGNLTIIDKSLDLHKLLITSTLTKMIKINGFEIFKSDALECATKVEAGRKIQAIKELKEKYKIIGLKEAKSLADEIANTKSIFLC